jgi:hypothetical protein
MLRKARRQAARDIRKATSKIMRPACPQCGGFPVPLVKKIPAPAQMEMYEMPVAWPPGNEALGQVAMRVTRKTITVATCQVCSLHAPGSYDDGKAKRTWAREHEKANPGHTVLIAALRCVR